MAVIRVVLRRSTVAVLAAIFLTVSAAAQPHAAQRHPSTSPASIGIGNFGRINANYYRGAQPDGHDYADLAALGVRTVIDLTREGRADEQALVKKAGMTFHRIPLTTSERPADLAISQFLNLVNDPANQPVFVHCQGGRHRTGVMTALYRMTEDGWTADRAYAEMKQFNFEGFPGHPVLKNFVFDYYKAIDRAHLAGNQPAPLAVGPVASK